MVVRSVSRRVALLALAVLVAVPLAPITIAHPNALTNPSVGPCPILPEGPDNTPSTNNPAGYPGSPVPFPLNQPICDLVTNTPPPAPVPGTSGVWGQVNPILGPAYAGAMPGGLPWTRHGLTENGGMFNQIGGFSTKTGFRLVFYWDTDVPIKARVQWGFAASALVNTAYPIGDVVDTAGIAVIDLQRADVDPAATVYFRIYDDLMLVPPSAANSFDIDNAWTEDMSGPYEIDLLVQVEIPDRPCENVDPQRLPTPNDPNVVVTLPPVGVTVSVPPVPGTGTQGPEARFDPIWEEYQDIEDLACDLQGEMTLENVAESVLIMAERVWDMTDQNVRIGQVLVTDQVLNYPINSLRPVTYVVDQSYPEEIMYPVPGLPGSLPGGATPLGPPVQDVWDHVLWNEAQAQYHWDNAPCTGVGDGVQSDVYGPYGPYTIPVPAIVPTGIPSMPIPGSPGGPVPTSTPAVPFPPAPTTPAIPNPGLPPPLFPTIMVPPITVPVYGGPLTVPPLLQPVGPMDVGYNLEYNVPDMIVQVSPMVPLHDGEKRGIDIPCIPTYVPYAPWGRDPAMPWEDEDLALGSRMAHHLGHYAFNLNDHPGVQPIALNPVLSTAGFEVGSGIECTVGTLDPPGPGALDPDVSAMSGGMHWDTTADKGRGRWVATELDREGMCSLPPGTSNWEALRGDYTAVPASTVPNHADSDYSRKRGNQNGCNLDIFILDHEGAMSHVQHFATHHNGLPYSVDPLCNPGPGLPTGTLVLPTFAPPCGPPNTPSIEILAPIDGAVYTEGNLPPLADASPQLAVPVGGIAGMDWIVPPIYANAIAHHPVFPYGVPSWDPLALDLPAGGTVQAKLRGQVACGGHAYANPDTTFTPGTPYVCDWDFVSGPLGVPSVHPPAPTPACAGTASPTSTTAHEPVVTFSEPGTYVYRFTVTDTSVLGFGQTATDLVTIEVNDANPTLCNMTEIADLGYADEPLDQATILADDPDDDSEHYGTNHELTPHNKGTNEITCLVARIVDANRDGSADRMDFHLQVKDCAVQPSDDEHAQQYWLSFSPSSGAREDLLETIEVRWDLSRPDAYGCREGHEMHLDNIADPDDPDVQGQVDRATTMAGQALQACWLAHSNAGHRIPAVDGDDNDRDAYFGTRSDVWPNPNCDMSRDVRVRWSRAPGQGSDTAPAPTPPPGPHTLIIEVPFEELGNPIPGDTIGHIRAFSWHASRGTDNELAATLAGTVPPGVGDAAGEPSIYFDDDDYAPDCGNAYLRIGYGDNGPKLEPTNPAMPLGGPLESCLDSVAALCPFNFQGVTDPWNDAHLRANTPAGPQDVRVPPGELSFLCGDDADPDLAVSTDPTLIPSVRIVVGMDIHDSVNHDMDEAYPDPYSDLPETDDEVGQLMMPVSYLFHFEGDTDGSKYLMVCMANGITYGYDAEADDFIPERWIKWDFASDRLTLDIPDAHPQRPATLIGTDEHTVWVETLAGECSIPGRNTWESTNYCPVAATVVVVTVTAPCFSVAFCPVVLGTPVVILTIFTCAPTPPVGPSSYPNLPPNPGEVIPRTGPLQRNEMLILDRIPDTGVLEVAGFPDDGSPDEFMAPGPSSGSASPSPSPPAPAPAVGAGVTTGAAPPSASPISAGSGSGPTSVLAGWAAGVADFFGGLADAFSAAAGPASPSLGPADPDPEVEGDEGSEGDGADSEGSAPVDEEPFMGGEAPDPDGPPVFEGPLDWPPTFMSCGPCPTWVVRLQLDGVAITGTTPLLPHPGTGIVPYLADSGMPWQLSQDLIFSHLNNGDHTITATLHRVPSSGILGPVIAFDEVEITVSLTPPIDTGVGGSSAGDGGVSRGADACVYDAERDLDGDHVNDECQGDSDGDGIPDPIDMCDHLAGTQDASDNDADGQGDACDPDDDNDEVLDGDDNCVFARNPQQSDIDADGLGDTCDQDRDGDGTEDLFDQLPSNPDETRDTDRDGRGNNADPDDDNDGVLDVDEAAIGLDAYNAASRQRALEGRSTGGVEGPAASDAWSMSWQAWVAIAGATGLLVLFVAMLAGRKPA